MGQCVPIEQIPKSATGSFKVYLKTVKLSKQFGFRPSQSDVAVNTYNHTGLIEWTQDVQMDTQWKIVNTLTRDPKDINTSLSIPLPLPPKVQLLSTHAISTEDGWRIEFPNEQSTISWTTVHPIEDQLTLEYTTLKDIPTALTWRVQCGQTIHCTFEGPPPTTHTDDLGKWIPTWHPYPEERLQIQANPLTSKPGETTQVQSLLLEHNINGEWIQSTANLTLKSSVSQPVKFTLPEGATLTRVYMNGDAYPFQPNQSLTLLTNIGTNTVDVSWKLKHEGWRHTLPAQFRSRHIQYNDQSTSRQRYIHCMGIQHLVSQFSTLLEHIAIAWTHGTWSS